MSGIYNHDITVITNKVHYITDTTLILSIAGCLFLLALLSFPYTSYASEVDYRELQEEPLDTAFRKLTTTGGIEWEDEEEMIVGGAPDIIKGMTWPLKSCKVGGLFNRSRSGGRRRHKGVDLLAPKGAPIYAALGGIVEVVSNGGRGFSGYGKVIIINHGDKLWTLYSHCSTMGVKVGQNVKQGDKIATVGRTGRATANHLHFEVRNSRGAALDPMKHLPKSGVILDK